MPPDTPGPLNLVEAIRLRTSVRRYRMEPVPASLLARVADSGRQVLPFDPSVETLFLPVTDGDRVNRALTGILGAYGKVIRAPHYLALLARPEGDWLLESGFRGEQLVLAATALGLGTCWVGGMFREDDLRSLLGAPPGLRLVAVTPLGWPSAAAGDRLVQRTFRALVPGRGKRRELNELVFDGRWGADPGRLLAAEPALRRVLDLVRAAPSWANRQPWRFVVEPGAVHLFVLPLTGGLTWREREGKDYRRVDAGIALCHLALAARDEGIAGELAAAADPALASRLGAPPGAVPVATFAARRS